MIRRLDRLRRDVQDSFWFLPTLIVLGAATLAALLIAEHTPWSQADVMRFPRLMGAGAEGARGMLSTIAGSTMTVVGVTLSMTLVVLALASSQYTSRVLRNFMRDRMTQVVLGLFAGIYVYCLIVLRTIRGGDESEFVPHVAVLVGVALAILGVAVLVYFIHHIATSIQASSIIASVADETLAAVEMLFPERLGDEPAHDDADDAPPGCRWQAVVVEGSGYIQRIDDAALLELARQHELLVRMERGVGEFVVAGQVLAFPEGGRVGFSVRLAAMPAASVTVTVARTSGDSDLTVQSGATLTFTPANWFTPQAVITFSAVSHQSTSQVSMRAAS